MNPLNWVMGKLFPPRPSGVLSLGELQASLRFQGRKQSDAMPCIANSLHCESEFSTSSWIRGRKQMLVVEGNLKGGVK